MQELGGPQGNGERNVKLKTEIARTRRGFAAMTAEQRREIARKGGRAAHMVGGAHEWNAETARAAGRKGGARVALDREHMAAIGRRGGMARAMRIREANAREDARIADAVRLLRAALEK